MQIQLKPLIDTDKRRVVVHLMSDEEIVKTLTFEITREQEPKLFDLAYDQDLYFLQGIDEPKLINAVENKLKQLFEKRYSLVHEQNNKDSYLQLTLDMEYDALASVEKILSAYANHKLMPYSREACMKIAIQYGFDDLLDRLDSNENKSMDDKQIQMMADDVKLRLRLQIERHLV